MSFYEVQFPPGISVGAAGGPTYDTEVVTFVSGLEQRNINWSVSRLKYDVSHNIKNQVALDQLIVFFRAMRGRAHGFRFKDWADYQVTVANGVLGTGVGSGVATYQMGKNYAQAGANTELRTIKKPVSGTIQLFNNGSPVTIGTGSGNATINYATGVVTFYTVFPTGANVLTWSGEFDVPCRFDTDELKASIVVFQTYSWSGVPIIEIRV